MRRYVPVFLSGCLVGLACAVGLQPAAPEPESPGALSSHREREKLREEAAILRWQLDGTRRRLRVEELWAELWKRAAVRAATPDAWPGPVVGTLIVRPAAADPAEPERIPAPVVPVPTRPSGEEP